MRDPKRIDEFMNVLTESWKTFPDWRFGQMMTNFLGFVSSETDADIFYIEDDKMLELLKEYF